LERYSLNWDGSSWIFLKEPYTFFTVTFLDPCVFQIDAPTNTTWTNTTNMTAMTTTMTAMTTTTTTTTTTTSMKETTTTPGDSDGTY
jgi:hypothetical protein